MMMIIVMIVTMMIIVMIVIIIIIIIITNFMAKSRRTLDNIHYGWMVQYGSRSSEYTRVGTLIVATIYLQLIQNRYMFRSFTVLQCSHQHCVQPVAMDVEVVGYL